VYVTGVERREYFSIIRKALLDINRSALILDAEEKVPCTCSDCRVRSEPYFYDYSHLMQRKHKGKTTIDCPRSIETVSLDELLAGIESPDSPGEGWDVFISYSSADIALAREVVADLEKRQARVWWDRDRIKPGDSISRQIEIGLRTSQFILPCISRKQIDSGWCRAEYAGALSKVLGGHSSQKVVPLILDDLDEADLPYLLSDFRAERKSDADGYEHLLAYISGR
jgi:hypothetical protein